MTRWLVVVVVGTIPVSGLAPARPAVSPRADALDLVLLGGPVPQRVELRVEIDGTSVPAVWDETFAKLHTFHDRDASGSLDKAEAARLPSAFALRQVLWGQFAPAAGDPPALSDLDADGNGTVAPAELADYYRRHGLGGVLVGVGTPPATDRLTDALLKQLDADRDGRVAEPEWKAAADVLRSLDANDDELIGPGELVEFAAYPGATGATLLSAPDPAAKSDVALAALPLVVLPLRTADTHWAAALAARTGAGAKELRSAAPAAAWAVRFGAETRRLAHAAGSTRFELRTDPGLLADQTAAARKRAVAQFAEYDGDGDGALSAAELAAPKGLPFRAVAAAADRDADGRLTAAEHAAWLDLVGQVAKGHVLLTVLDHGRGLFEALDADRDGALSARELRTAWARVGSGFGRAKLPRHLLATVSQGRPRELPGKPARTGPAWFLAADRNGDGDVSRREFLGPAAAFGRLDADRDGLIDAAEANRSEPKPNIR